MIAHWTYTGGMLVARNDTGKLLAAWEADASMGQPLADLFNHAQDLSAVVLQPFTVWAGVPMR